MSELRAAVERRRKWRETHSVEAGFHSLDLDASVLADAYLSEHPADDDEPVTEDWLYSIGFEERNGMPTRNGLRIRPQSITVSACGSLPAYACVHNYPISLPKTRGDVRRLLAALGVEGK